ncbi:MAG: type I restriction enzyme HsdR N-terminal domain-containing protein [Prevotella sp.]|jgi:hypothetical protein|nr:type I restriction enzyme HsdR N-terminal domain-containing protein [Prevotella sp.]
MTEQLTLPKYQLRLKKEHNRTYVYDEIRHKYLVLTPEEEVRQRFVHFLATEKGYPKSLMMLEHGLTVNGVKLRTDLLVCGGDGAPIMVVEFKAPSIKLTQDAFDQIARYNMRFRVSCIAVTNGILHYCCKLDSVSNSWIFLPEIPAYKELTAN